MLQMSTSNKKHLQRKKKPLKIKSLKIKTTGQKSYALASLERNSVAHLSQYISFYFTRATYKKQLRCKKSEFRLFIINGGHPHSLN